MPGQGAVGHVEGHDIRIGRGISIEIDGKLSGNIIVADALKPTSADAAMSLRRQGLKVIMLTGDKERTARTVDRNVALDDVIPPRLPSQHYHATPPLHHPRHLPPT